MPDNLTQGEAGRVTVDELAGEMLLDPRAAALRLAVAPQTLAKWRCTGGGPRFIRLSARMIRYRARDVDAWLAARTASHTTSAPPVPAA